MDDEPNIIKPDIPPTEAVSTPPTPSQDLTPGSATIISPSPVAQPNTSEPTSSALSQLGADKYSTDPNPAPQVQPQVTSPSLDSTSSAQTQATVSLQTSPTQPVEFTPTSNINNQQAVNTPLQPVDKPKKSKLGLMLVLGLIIIICAGGAYAFYAYVNKTSYQTVIQEFVTSMENKDKASADSLESPSMKTTAQKYYGTSSFYTACQKAGDFCTPLFTSSYINKATKTYKDYTASDGAKGKEVVYSLKQTVSGSQGCSGGSSTNTLTIAAVPNGSSWLIDEAAPTISAENVQLCPATGGTSSANNTLSQNANNTSRKNDISAILSTIGEYNANNNGLLPQTASPGSTPDALLICNKNCTAANSSSANLGYYSPSKVTFHSYASNLVVPDDGTIYLVDGANCTKGTSIGGQGYLSTVVLYALQSGSGIEQQCQAS
jgi:hypothetical protein